LVSSLIVTSILADTSLGQKISVGTAQEQIVNGHSSQNTAHSTNHQLETRVSPTNVKNSFKSDHHRYDKRYVNFNYDRDAYYNDEGLYFGYYDTTGYFFNNIFFAYNSNYSYNDRRYRRGFFRHGHRHHRRYIHHTFNDWNRIHCYREPNVIVRGHYYDRAYYPRSRPHVTTHNHYYSRPKYNNQRDNSYRNNNHRNDHHRNSMRNDYHRPHNTPSRMSVTRMQDNRSNTRTPTRTQSNNYRNNTHRNSMQQGHRPSSSHTRMNTRSSSQGQKGGRHMGISR